MLAVQGYYDVVTKHNQRVIITVMDNLVEPAKTVRKKGMRGILAQYADPALTEKEKDAWEHAIVEKYGNV